MEKEEFKKKLTNLSKKIDIELSEEETDKFYEYMETLIVWNEKINLTAIIEPDEIILKHFIDSLVVKKYIKPESRLIDIGTGAGFPGIPFKITDNSLKITLLDSLNKRIMFLNEIVEKLKLKNVENLHGRAEEYAQNTEYREQYDIVISRAVAKLTVLVEYMIPFIKVGGICICMKGPNIEEELDEAKKAIKILGGEIEKVEELILPEGENKRSVIIIRKKCSTPSKYPRKAGIVQKEPIK